MQTGITYTYFKMDVKVIKKEKSDYWVMKSFSVIKNEHITFWFYSSWWCLSTTQIMQNSCKDMCGKLTSYKIALDYPVGTFWILQWRFSQVCWMLHPIGHTRKNMVECSRIVYIAQLLCCKISNHGDRTMFSSWGSYLHTQKWPGIKDSSQALDVCLK